MEGGTLLQLRNLINRRNISADISGKFNAAIDFFELVVAGYVLAAAMNYFGLNSLKGTPTRNVICLSVNKEKSWCTLKRAAQNIVDKYVMVNELLVDTTNGNKDSRTTRDAAQVKKTAVNPHAARIAVEHNYCIPAEPARAQKKRKLPSWMINDFAVPVSVHKKAPDGVFNYSSAVLNDGLLLLELRDGIHEGDGQRVVRCWKFMLLHWRYAKHTKYSLEALHLLAAVNATATERIAHEIVWGRFINPNQRGTWREHASRPLHGTFKPYLKRLCERTWSKYLGDNCHSNQQIPP